MTPAQQQQIEQTCQAAGVSLRAMNIREDVLLLQVASFAELPAPETLQQLGDELRRRFDVRWVALDLDGVES